MSNFIFFDRSVVINFYLLSIEEIKSILIYPMTQLKFPVPQRLRNEKSFHHTFDFIPKRIFLPFLMRYRYRIPYKFFLFFSTSGTLLESRASFSIQSPANCGDLLPILSNGPAAKDGVRIAAVRTMYKTERLEKPAFLRQGESGETIEIHGGVGDDKDQTEWILS